MDKKKPVIFFGDPGIGKTSSVYEIARRKKINVIEFNISDSRRKSEFERISQTMSMKTQEPCVFLFDEIDGFRNFPRLKKLFISPRHPIICTCNDIYKVPRDVVALTEKIKFYPPTKNQIVQLIKDKNIKGNFSQISYDVRNSLLTVENKGAQAYEDHRNMFETTKKIFNGTFKGPWLRTQFIWIFDNIPEFYSGRNLVVANYLLAQADIQNNPDLLKHLPKPNRYGAKIGRPNYLIRKPILMRMMASGISSNKNKVKKIKRTKKKV